MTGGKSSRMGRDKAFIEIDGIPLWRRQLQLLKQLQPSEIFISGRAHAEWKDEECVTVSDVRANAGPLAGLIGALRRCSTPLLFTLAVDLPKMTTAYLRELVALCSEGNGIIPRLKDRFEPLVAVYPVTSLPLAESCLSAHNFSLQEFAARCVSERFVRCKPVRETDERLFFNMNTPEDLSIVAAVYDRRKRGLQSLPSAVRRYK